MSTSACAGNVTNPGYSPITKTDTFKVTPFDIAIALGFESVRCNADRRTDRPIYPLDAEADASDAYWKKLAGRAALSERFGRVRVSGREQELLLWPSLPQR